MADAPFLPGMAGLPALFARPPVLAALAELARAEDLFADAIAARNRAAAAGDGRELALCRASVTAAAGGFAVAANRLAVVLRTQAEAVAKAAVRSGGKAAST